MINDIVMVIDQPTPSWHRSSMSTTHIPDEDENDGLQNDGELDRLAQDVSKSRNYQPQPRLFHPKTIDEAAEIVIKGMASGNLDMIMQAADKDEFVTEQHFGMGLWIRNVMIHQNQNVLDLMADYQKVCGIENWNGYPPADPDAVSGVIIGLVWEKLHKLQ